MAVVEKEYQKKHFDLQEEDSVRTMEHIRRRLDTDSDQWALVDARQEVLPDGRRLYRGSHYYMVERVEPTLSRRCQEVIKVNHHCPDSLIAVFRNDPITSAFTAIAIVLKLKTKWKPSDHQGRVVNRKRQLRHQHCYTPKIFKKRASTPETVNELAMQIKTAPKKNTTAIHEGTYPDN
jgi:hypothetical protein